MFARIRHAEQRKGFLAHLVGLCQHVAYMGLAAAKLLRFLKRFAGRVSIGAFQMYKPQVIVTFGVVAAVQMRVLLCAVL